MESSAADLHQFCNREFWEYYARKKDQDKQLQKYDCSVHHRKLEIGIASHAE